MYRPSQCTGITLESQWSFPRHEVLPKQLSSMNVPSCNVSQLSSSYPKQSGMADARESNSRQRPPYCVILKLTGEATLLSTSLAYVSIVV